MIHLKKALEMMRMKDHRGRFVPFSMTFVACDSTRKTGGELVTYNHVKLPQRERTELDTIDRQLKEAPERPIRKTTLTFETSGGEFRQCHIQLITRFNGEQVI